MDFCWTPARCRPRSRHLQQGYYRRGDANFALGHFKPALKDFQKAARLNPRDPDLRRKLTECERIVKRMRFEESLALPVGI
jgi:serine/threonine-protein phosphatase 5